MAPEPIAPPGAWAEWTAPAHWRCVEVHSDVHLHTDEPETAAWWAHYLSHTRADAVVVLGDLFEVWIGDDSLRQAGDTGQAFLARCASQLRALSARRPLYIMVGNRDFLLGAEAMQAFGAQALHDPTVLAFGPQRWLLSHGDAWCLDDTDYQRFRSEVRSPPWQRQFLSRPLAERAAIARGLRAGSEARKAMQAMHADVDDATALDWLRRSASQTLVHGHTHQPADHGWAGQPGLRRMVLSDWDARAQPPRGEVLRLWHDGRAERVVPERPAATAP